MARLTGPLMSLDASGSVAGSLTFAKWKGRNYVRQLVTPANPKSAAQVAFRAMFGFLSRAWADVDSLSAGAQASWDALAESGNFSAFNAYMKQNQDRWGRALSPEADSAGGASAATGDTLTAATAGVKSIQLAITCDANSDNWGNIIYRKVGSQPTGLQTEVIAVIPRVNDDDITYDDLRLTTGLEYYYRIQTFDLYGFKATIGTEQHATPT